MTIATIYQKSSPWGKVFGASLVITMLFLCFSASHSEGFDGRRKSAMFDVKRKDAVYDEFYVSIYDDLMFCKEQHEFELATFLDATKPIRGKSKILDIGSGTGHHVAALSQKKYSVVGIDNSSAMVKKAMQNYPSCHFKLENAVNPLIFPHGSFSHITCFHFTVYYFKDKRNFLKNCYDWLLPGGYLALHMINSTKFSAERFTNGEQTKTTLAFNYKSNFEHNAREGGATLNEEIIDTMTGAVRKNEHQLYMPRMADIIQHAKSVKFKLIKRVDMSSCQRNSQYLYILQK
jgi:SAM-dependent methyltransferase